MRRPSKHHVHTRGFTMAELLIASVLGSMVILSVYSVFVKTSTYYAQQLEQTQVQSSTRFAMEYLKAELRDIGRLSVLNTNEQFRDSLYCGNRNYQGLILRETNGANNGNNDSYTPAPILQRHNIEPDRLQLLIDASDATPLQVAAQNGAELILVTGQLQNTIEARRMLSLGAETRFNNLFDTQSFLRVTNLETGRYDIVPIRSARLQNEQARIRLTELPCNALNCHTGNCVVNPIHWVEYVILHQPDDPEHTFFVRRRLDVDDATPIDQSQLMLADHAVNFQVWGLYDTRNQEANAIMVNQENRLPMIPMDQIQKDDRGNWNPNVLESVYFERWGHRVRGLNILLSTRAARIDPLLKEKIILENEGPQERTWIEVDTGKQIGVARVSSLIGSVETPNLYHGK